MTIYYRDQLGYIAVEVNEFGIDFDQSENLAVFEDGNGKEYRIPLSNLHSIAE